MVWCLINLSGEPGLAQSPLPSDPDHHSTFDYDAENRLIRVDEFAAGSSTPGATFTYRYDGLGRRIEKVGNGVRLS
jgi:YD repeat-containing protein